MDIKHFECPDTPHRQTDITLQDRQHVFFFNEGSRSPQRKHKHLCTIPLSKADPVDNNVYPDILNFTQLNIFPTL